MGNMSAIGQRVRRRMLELNIGTIKELEQRAGLTKDTIRHLIAGRTNTIRSSKLPGLAQALDMSLDELVHGEKPTDQPATAMPFSMQEHPEEIIGQLRFDTAALTSFGAASGEPTWLKAQSDNMHPTIGVGDIVLIDSAIRQIDGDGIFCIASCRGGHSFKRVQISAVSGLLSLANDNPKYSAETGINPSDLKVVGKVLGAFKRI